MERSKSNARVEVVLHSSDLRSAARANLGTLEIGGPSSANPAHTGRAHDAAEGSDASLARFVSARRQRCAGRDSHEGGDFDGFSAAHGASPLIGRLGGTVATMRR
ncbi:hypothetical protein [Burkholderia gladioli]|uniref:hypothetical protein n=1 Tax=Burkholderia gladioli TaxID=28095 RepID=UPI00164190E7|nr:hypothetical protein [Burkholderia gladioli]